MLRFAALTIFLAYLANFGCHGDSVEVSPLHPPASGRVFEGQIREFLEKVRGIMKNGDPEQGIPPMEPLAIPHYDFDFIVDEETRLAGYIDLFAHNVSDFIVSQCQFTLPEFKLSLGLRFNNLPIEGKYKGKGKIFNDVMDAEGAFLSTTTNLDVGLLIHLGSNLNRTIIKEIDISYLFAHDEIIYTNILNDGSGTLDNDYLKPLLYRIRDEIFNRLMVTLRLVGNDLVHDFTLDQILKMFLDIIGGGGNGFISSLPGF